MAKYLCPTGAFHDWEDERPPAAGSPHQAVRQLRFCPDHDGTPAPTPQAADPEEPADPRLDEGAE